MRVTPVNTWVSSGTDAAALAAEMLELIDGLGDFASLAGLWAAGSCVAALALAQFIRHGR